MCKWRLRQRSVLQLTRGVPRSLEEVPHLDDVALRVLDVDRAVAARMLGWPAHAAPVVVQPLAQGIQRAWLGREREVDVAAALVAELLLAGRPEAEPRFVAGREPDAVVLTRE